MNHFILSKILKIVLFPLILLYFIFWVGPVFPFCFMIDVFAISISFFADSNYEPMTVSLFTPYEKWKNL